MPDMAEQSTGIKNMAALRIANLPTTLQPKTAEPSTGTQITELLIQAPLIKTLQKEEVQSTGITITAK